MNTIKVKNPLSTDVKLSSVTQLQPLVATFQDLYLEAKMAHWNVRGLDFLPVHRMFDEIVDAAGGWADRLAERIGALGYANKANRANLCELSLLPENTLTLDNSAAHIEYIGNCLAVCSAALSDAISEVDKAEDEGTLNALQDMLEEVDKQLWFVSSHIKM